MSDSTASMYDSKAPHLPGVGSQLLLGLQSLYFSKSCSCGLEKSCKSSPESGCFLEKCSVSRSLRKNSRVSSLTCFSSTSCGVGQKFRPLESSEVSDSDRGTLEVLSTGQISGISNCLSPAMTFLRLKRLERGLQDLLTWASDRVFLVCGTLSQRNFFSRVFLRSVVRAILYVLIILWASSKSAWDMLSLREDSWDEISFSYCRILWLSQERQSDMSCFEHL